MPSIFHASTAALTSPARFPAGSLIVDARYRRQEPPWGPTQVEALFPGRYVLSEALGSMECANHDFAAICPVIDYRSGLAAVQAVLQPAQDVVVLCDCLEQVGRSHRRQVTTALAVALGLVDGGPLP